MRLVSFDLEGLKKKAALIAKQFRLYDKHIRDFGLSYNHGGDALPYTRVLPGCSPDA
jgi:hypothetical protein